MENLIIENFNLSFDLTFITVLFFRAVEFVPELPELKLKSINRLGVGVINKVVLFFPTIFWDRSVR